MSRADLKASVSALAFGDPPADLVRTLGPGYVFPWHGLSPIEEIEHGLRIARATLQATRLSFEEGEAYVAQLAYTYDASSPGENMILDAPLVTTTDVERAAEQFGMTSPRDLLAEINGTLRERGLGPRGSRGRARR